MPYRKSHHSGKLKRPEMLLAGILLILAGVFAGAVLVLKKGLPPMLVFVPGLPMVSVGFALCVCAFR